MAKPYSDDLRARVISALAAGLNSRAVAAQFDIAPSTVVKWSQRKRRTGSVSPAKFGGHKKSILEPHERFILQLINETPHLTLHGLQALLAARGVKVSHDSVWRFLRRKGLSFKKNSVRKRATAC